MEKKLGQNGAFPLCAENENGILYYSEGISKRFYAACAAMQGILIAGKDILVEHIVHDAYMIADELLKQEEE